MASKDRGVGIMNRAQNLHGNVNMAQAARIDSVTFVVPGGGSASAVVTPLPASSAASEEVFVGRGDEIELLLDMLSPRECAGGAVVVPVVAGMGGIGKTTLARRAGMRAVERGWFPGGAVIVDLYGYDPDPQQRVRPCQVFGPLLRALGVAEREIPSAAGEQAAVYHRVLNQWAGQGRRVLVVLDNASATDQVRDLLPRQGAHRVVVTTRDTLTLPTARRLSLDVLDTDHALELIACALHHQDSTDPRTEQDQVGLRRIVELCDGLPLAVEITAALLADDPDLRVDEFVKNLEQARLPTLAWGDTSVAAVLSLSWHRLRDSSPEAARLLRLLAAAPGPSISTEAAAVLADVTPARVWPLLRTLRQAHLLQRRSGARWALHDLIRTYTARSPPITPAPATPTRWAWRRRWIGFWTST
ncbi:NB-ARC domain-containing protein [Saccharopolyspora shandongensis]|uniref:NB-ARC domain-containing protein n=1 Tax=Saccharopolyspora shandongensis TaxID=418495 RepID=UPI0033E5D71D